MSSVRWKHYACLKVHRRTHNRALRLEIRLFLCRSRTYGKVDHDLRLVYTQSKSQLMFIVRRFWSFGRSLSLVEPGCLVEPGYRFRLRCTVMGGGSTISAWLLQFFGSSAWHCAESDPLAPCGKGPENRSTKEHIGPQVQEHIIPQRLRLFVRRVRAA
jgi:hypothetical protein